LPRPSDLEKLLSGDKNTDLYLLTNIVKVLRDRQITLYQRVIGLENSNQNKEGGKRKKRRRRTKRKRTKRKRRKKKSCRRR
jgi:hypothetical protein